MVSFGWMGVDSWATSGRGQVMYTLVAQGLLLVVFQGLQLVLWIESGRSCARQMPYL